MTIDNLNFIRLTSPSQFELIPRYLFEQVKKTDFIIERLYQFGPAALANPLTFLYVLADKKTSVIKGILWAEINPYSEIFFVNILSIDSEYQNGESIEKTTELLKIIQKQNNLKKIQMITGRPKVYEKKHGWQRSTQIIMEK